MNTRSKTKYDNNAVYEVNIDFDEASNAWRDNKKNLNKGTFKYICCGMTKTGNKCNRQPLENSEYCKIHSK